MHDSFHQNNNNNFNIIGNELMHNIYIMNLWIKQILNFAAYHNDSEWRLWRLCHCWVTESRAPQTQCLRKSKSSITAQTIRIWQLNIEI
jgi:hypothetical protein